MKNFYLLIITTALFSTASAQTGSQQSRDIHPASYVDVNGDGQYNDLDGDYFLFNDNTNQPVEIDRVLHINNILWLFNDVGNVLRFNGNTPAAGLETPSSGRPLLKRSGK